MDILELTYPEPLVVDPAWAITDSTKLKGFMVCERAYFYRRVLGWQSEFVSNHLHFGKCWHFAQEHLLLNIKRGYTSEVVLEAYERFLAPYREAIPEEMDAKYAPKDPANALEALVQYAERYKNDPEEIEVLYTEVAGSVPIDDEHMIHFKIDSVLRHIEYNILTREHKTTGREAETWRKSWHLSMQAGAYTHALCCIPEFDDEEIYGIEINGTILRKKGNEHVRVPIRKTHEQMRVWLWNTQYLYTMLDWNFQHLAEASVDDDILMCFPMNTENCTKYGVCPFWTYCNAWPNPLQRCAEPPPGFVVRHWDPRQMEEEAHYHAGENGIRKQSSPSEPSAI